MLKLIFRNKHKQQGAVWEKKEGFLLYSIPIQKINGPSQDAHILVCNLTPGKHTAMGLHEASYRQNVTSGHADEA